VRLGDKLSVIFPRDSEPFVATDILSMTRVLIQGLTMANDVEGVRGCSHTALTTITFEGIECPPFVRVVKAHEDGPIVHGPTAVLIVISDVS